MPEEILTLWGLLVFSFAGAARWKLTQQNGWSEWSYGVGKLGVILLSKIQAEKISLDESKQDIHVNAVSTVGGTPILWSTETISLPNPSQTK